MANHNDFDAMVNQARHAQREQQDQVRQEQQARRQAFEATRAQVIEARHRTLELARHAANLLVQCQVTPSVRLRRALPLTWTKKLFRDPEPNPISYEAVAEGWPVAQDWHNTPYHNYENDIWDVQGVLLTRDGTLLQYTGGERKEASYLSGPAPAEPVGDVTVTAYAALGSDPQHDAVVVWNYPGRSNSPYRLFVEGAGYHPYQDPTFGFDYSGHGANGADIEARLQSYLASTVARYTSDHNS